MTTPSVAKNYHVLSGSIIMLLCLGLFYLDKDTHSVFDLVKPGMLVVLLFYCLPTYILCWISYTVLKKRNVTNSKVLALCIGITVGFSLMMLFFA